MLLLKKLPISHSAENFSVKGFPLCCVMADPRMRAAGDGAHLA